MAGNRGHVVSHGIISCERPEPSFNIKIVIPVHWLSSISQPSYLQHEYPCTSKTTSWHHIETAPRITSTRPVSLIQKIIFNNWQIIRDQNNTISRTIWINTLFAIGVYWKGPFTQELKQQHNRLTSFYLLLEIKPNVHYKLWIAAPQIDLYSSRYSVGIF